MALTVDASINPIKVTGTTNASQAITDEVNVIIQKIVWYGATTNAHKLSLTDSDGNQLYKATMATTALTENIESDFPRGLIANGISCDDMDSGELYIYI